MSILRIGALILSLAAASTVTASEETIVAPTRVVLSNNPIEIHLDNAQLVIHWDATDQPTLDFWWTLEEAPGSLSVETSGAKTRVESISEETIDGRAIIEVHLLPEQSVTLNTTGCSVDVDHPVVEEVEVEEEESEDQPGSLLDATLTRSNTTLTGISGAHVTTVDGAFFSSDSSGVWHVDATGGSVELQRHTGDLSYVATDSTAKIERSTGKIAIELHGGSLNAGALSGSISASLHDAEMSIEGSRATINITGDGSNIELFNTMTSHVKINGDRHTIRIEDSEASGHLNITQSNLTINGWRKRLNLTLRDRTSANVEAVEGDVAFKAIDSTFELRSVSRHCRGTATNSVFNAEDLRSIELDGSDAEITIIDARHLNKLAVRDSRVMLDLPRLRDKRTITLQGTSTAEVSLPRPCQVRFFGTQPESTSHASVSGCTELGVNENWRRQRKVHPDEPSLVSLGVSLGPEASIRVAGR